MKETETQGDFVKIVKDLTELRRVKSLAYGDGFMLNYIKYGDDALFFDLLRKWQRIETILYNKGENLVSDETIKDTLGDLAVMCVNAIVWMER